MGSLAMVPPNGSGINYLLFPFNMRAVKAEWLCYQDPAKMLTKVGCVVFLLAPAPFISVKKIPEEGSSGRKALSSEAMMGANALYLSCQRATHQKYGR